MALTIGSATSAEDAQARLTQWASSRASDEEIAASLYKAVMLADLGGQMFVRTVEVPETLPEERALAADGGIAAPSERPAFLNLPFEEAIRLFTERRLVSPEEFRRLSDDARTRAFTATGLASEQVAARAYELLVQALETGSTLDDFAAQLRREEVSLGITPSDPAYVSNVYRTNIASAYGAGRYRQLRSPVVRAARPYVEYRATMDNRTRPSHAALNGVIFSQDDPEWPSFAPPNGFQCRCVVVARSHAPRSVTAASSLGADAQPDEGFNAPPAVDFEE